MLSKPIRIDRQIISSIPFWSWPSAVSVDAVVVALLWQWFFAKSFAYNLNWHEQAILALTVWLIYVADRVVDSYRLDLNKEHSFRHAFVLKYRRIFVSLGFFVLAFDLYLIVTGLSIREIAFGLTLFGLVLLYALLGVVGGWARAPKELLIGLIFSVGVNVLFLSQGVKPALLYAMAVFSVLATINCMLIAIWESQLDRAQGYDSIAQNSKNLIVFIRKILIAVILLSAATYLTNKHIIYVSFSLSAFAMLYLSRTRIIESTELLRLLVDLSLMSPIFYFLLQRYA